MAKEITASSSSGSWSTSLTSTANGLPKSLASPPAAPKLTGAFGASGGRPGDICTGAGAAAGGSGASPNGGSGGSGGSAGSWSSSPAGSGATAGG